MARGDKQVNVWPLRMDERGKFRPKADPGGDYAQELFDKADTVHPGATAALEAKARAVVGATVEPARGDAQAPYRRVDQLLEFTQDDA